MVGLSGNWIAGVPRQTTDANINTVTPNSTEIRDPGATALNLTVGPNGTGMLTIQTGGTLTDIARDNWQFTGRAGHGDGDRRRAPTGRMSETLVVGGLGTGTLTIQDGGTVNSGGGGSVGLSAGSTGTVTVTGPGSSWNNGPAAGSISAVLARARSRSQTVGRSSITPPSPPTSAMVQARWVR